MRTLLTVLGVAFGVMLFVAIQSINRSTLMSFQDSMEAISGKASLVITGGTTGFPEKKLEDLREFKEIRFTAPLVENPAYFTTKSQKDENLVILGVDMLKESSIRSYKTTDDEIMDDPLIFLNQPDSVIVTKEFADRNNLKIDSKIEVASVAGKKLLTIRGLLTPEGTAKAYGGALAIMDIDGARETFGKVGKVDRIDLVTKKDVDPDELALRIGKLLGPGYKVERPQENSKAMEKLVKSYQVLLSFFSTLALLVSVFLVVNTVGISVAERKREIGTLRALGALKISITALFISEAFVMGLIGSVFGVGFGRVLASQMIGLVSRSISGQYVMPIHINKIYFGSDQIVSGIILGTLASTLAATWPSFRAAQIKPLEAMKKVGGEVTARQKITGTGFYIGLAMLIYLVISSFLGWGHKYYIFEIVGQGCTIIGSALVAPTLVTSMILVFKKLFSRSKNTVLRFAEDNLLRYPQRTGSNVMTLLIGLILVIMVSALNSSFKDTLNSWFLKVLKADIVVHSSGKLSSFQSQPLDEKVGHELEKVPGILMGPERGVYGMRFIHFNFEDKQLGMKALDKPDPSIHFATIALKSSGDIQKVGERLFDEEKNLNEPSILVSEIFTSHHHYQAGDSVVINTPTGAVKFKILDVMIDYASPEGMIYISRPTFKRYWQDNLVDGFSLNVLPGVDPNTVRREIESKFGKEKNLITVSQKELREQVLMEVDSSFAYTKAIEAAALLVGMLGLFNTFLISVMERTRELGMLRAIGMERAQVVWMILSEAVLQGGFGAAVAVILGGGISYIFVKNDLTYMLGWIVDFSFPWTIVVITMGLGVFVSCLAAIYPAIVASRLEIRDALEYE